MFKKNTWENIYVVLCTFYLYMYICIYKRYKYDMMKCCLESRRHILYNNINIEEVYYFSCENEQKKEDIEKEKSDETRDDTIWDSSLFFLC